MQIFLVMIEDISGYGMDGVESVHSTLELAQTYINAKGLYKRDHFVLEMTLDPTPPTPLED